MLLTVIYKVLITADQVYPQPGKISPNNKKKKNEMEVKNRKFPQKPPESYKTWQKKIKNQIFTGMMPIYQISLKILSIFWKIKGPKKIVTEHPLTT